MSRPSEVTAGQSTRRTVHVVPHTHWDREWYQPFQAFRLQLLDLLDQLIPQMADGATTSRFLLDGQLAVIDDYLALRPEAAEPLRHLVESGRVSIGPWYTLPDEFLVSGETLVRNLQLGLRTAARFGGAMEVGYLPDMFGHVAQMPQILAGFGFEDAVVWRGVPAAVNRSGFWWQAPDRSTVRAEYMPQGYGNGWALPEDPDALVRAIDGFAAAWRDLLVGPVLWMNGTDHQVPRPWLARVVAEAAALRPDLDVRITSLPEHLAAAPREGLPSWQGELRSGARANLLMGVTSNRVDVRQAAAGAERALERRAEPLSALFLPAERWPASALDEAWRLVVLNAAHDSVCACSVDEVGDAVLHRYAEATAIAHGLADRAVLHLAGRVAHRGPLVVNPTARPRGGLVELALAGTEPPAGTQVVDARPVEVIALQGPPALVVPAVDELEWSPAVSAFSLEDAAGSVLVSAERAPTGALITPEVRAALAAAAAQAPAGIAGGSTAVGSDGELRVRVRQRPQVTVLAQADDVPGFGWTPWDPSVPRSPAHPVTVQAGAGASAGTGHPLVTNGLVTLAVDPDDGTFAVDGVAGLGRLVDGGDCGDTYNWCPPAHDRLVDRPEEVAVEVVDRGPLRARVRLTARYRWPAGVEELDHRVGEAVHDVVTTIELRADERAVRVETTVDNRSRNHRLRVHLPLPRPAVGSCAETAFGTVERGLVAEGGPNEAPLPTFPALRFVQAGGLTVVHDGVTEYELVELHDGRAHELALTLLRCTGMLSQRPMASRPLPAGPLLPLQGPQLQKPVTRRYALAVGDIDPYALADDVLVPLLVAGAAGDGTRQPADASLPARGTALMVTGAEVSAVVRGPEGLTVRVVNPGTELATVTLPGRRGWLVDLRGRRQARFEGSFALRPWGIATAVLAD